mmetsp:Transcript_7167/g.5433  ORF Transcript_7167/g.5433 Transcript_7167/m.5433 type:complete len:93 (+) Transcript_7167:442-720(+)
MVEYMTQDYYDTRCASSVGCQTLYPSLDYSYEFCCAAVTYTSDNGESKLFRCINQDQDTLVNTTDSYQMSIYCTNAIVNTVSILLLLAATLL